MKRILTLLMACILLIGLAGCATADGATQDNAASAADGGDDAAEGGSAESGNAAGTVDGVLVEGDGFSFVLPQGWSVQDSNDEVTTYVSSDYPANANNVALTVGGKDPEFESYTAQAVESLYAGQFDGFSMTTFERITQSDRPTILLIYDLILNGTEMTQYVYMIDLPDSTVSLIFTEVLEDAAATVQTTMDSFVAE